MRHFFISLLFYVSTFVSILGGLKEAVVILEKLFGIKIDFKKYFKKTKNVRRSKT